MDRSHRVDISGLLSGGRQLMVIDDEVPIEPFEGIAFPEPARVALELRQADRMLAIEGTVDAQAAVTAIGAWKTWTCRCTSTSTSGSIRRRAATTIPSAIVTS